MTPRRPIRALWAPISLALILAACSSGGASSAPTSTPAASTAPSATPAASAAASGPFTICFMPKFIGHPVFTLANEGAQAAAKELGDTVNYVGSTKIDAAEQVKAIETCIQQKVDAISVGALDPNAVGTALKAANTAGIVTTTWDADVTPDARSLFVSTPTAESLGKAMAEMLGKAMNYEGKWAWLSSGPDVANQVAWINATEEYMKANADKFAKMENVATVYGESDDTKSFQAAEGLMAKYPDLKGIISPDAGGLPATARAIQGLNKCGQVWATGVALPSAMKTYVDSDCVKEFALWDFHDLGYLTIYATHDLLAGASIKPGDTLQVGSLGTRVVAPDGSIAVSEPVIYDKSNVGE